MHAVIAIMHVLKVGFQPKTNRSKLKTRYAVFMVMFQKRTNLRPNIVGRIFGVHRTTVKRQAQTVDTALENVLPTAPAMNVFRSLQAWS